VGIYDLPVSDAGSDQTIQYGTTTTLDGSASAGTPDYTYHWEPADSLMNPDIADPQTVNLHLSKEFTLTVTDSHGCQHSDAMYLEVEGGPLSVLATADPTAICLGESSQLNAMGSGGSTTYTYSWTSDVGGFSSTQQNPLVSPDQTTAYTVVIDDGYNSKSSSVTVTVHPLPGTSVWADAISIPYGSKTHLYSEGAISGPFNYSWRPSSLLANPGNDNTERRTWNILLPSGHAWSIRQQAVPTVPV